MPVIDPDIFEPIERPELVFGVVAAVGTPLQFVCNTLDRSLQNRGYEVSTISLSQQLAGLSLESPAPATGGANYRQIMAKMDQGNEIRKMAGGGEALALLAAARINELRPDDDPNGKPLGLSGRAFILRQLKHPDEVLWLRRIYGDAFHLVGVYCPEAVRQSNLKLHEGMSEDEAEEVIRRDEGEEMGYGQQLRDTYYRSDVFARLDGHNDVAAAAMTEQLERYIRLLFGELDKGILTPTVDEYGIYLASAAALRSGDLSRQVGAAIMSENREVLALGTNEVPTSGGGQYWSDYPGGRDCDLGYDSNARMKERILREILEVIDQEYALLSPDEQQERLKTVAKRLDDTRLMNLTEFGRAVHAEMDAILAAGRIGTATRGTTLYTTTFPCHNCAKHIVAAGIKRVVYVEPYPKSMAEELHGDSISFSDNSGDERILVRFDSFVGVAPRKFEALFSTLASDGQRLRRKNPDGSVRRDHLGLRIRAEALTYIERESAAALAAARMGMEILKEDER